MKKRILRYRRKKVYDLAARFAAVAAALTMAVLMPVNASAEEAGTAADREGGNTEKAAPAACEHQVIHYVYHCHAGTSDEEGGCYRGAITHTHQGNEVEGGTCYGKPVYHVHQGNETEGGVCYQTTICHEHSGNPQEGEGCFVPVYHSHSGGCYKTVTSREYGCTTVRWWDTSDGDYEGNDFKYYEMSCGTTVHGTNSSHNHTVAVCSRGGSIERYTLGCGKTEETPESYVFDCEKKPGLTVDAYEFNCEKTEDTIDGYRLSCGMDESTKAGRITLTEIPEEDRRKAAIKAEFEDLTGGKLTLSDNPFCWKDKNGSLISNEREAVVDRNGEYTFFVDVVSEEVKKENLSAAISVSSIYMPAGGSESGGSGEEDKGSGSGGKENQGSDTGSEEEQTSPTPAASATPVPSVSPAPSEKPKIPEGGREHGRGNGNDSAAADDRTDSTGAWWQKDGQDALPGVLTETETVVLPEKAANRDIELEELTDQGKERNGNLLEKILSTGVVRVIGITFFSLLTLTGLSLLIYFLCMSVRLYNDQGQGKWKYLGRYPVKLDEDGYLLAITENVVEKSVTNRYRIRPELFGLLRKEDELLVRKEERTVSVQIRKEMVVVV